MPLGETLGKVLGEGHADAMRAIVKRTVMALEVGRLTADGLYKRTDKHKTHRNGDRDRAWDTRTGTLGLREETRMQLERPADMIPSRRRRLPRTNG